MGNPTGVFFCSPVLTTVVERDKLKLTIVVEEGECHISEAFSRLEPAKQERIIRAALDEFAKHGYDGASTNRIVKEAGIAKGMLFYYFQNKQELYYYLVDYALDYVNLEYLVHLDPSEADFLARYSQAAKVKMKSYIKNSEVFEFLGSLYLEQNGEVPKELWERIDQMNRNGMKKMLDNVDTSLFREDISPEYVMKITTWALEGYQKELVGRLKSESLSKKDLEPYWDEFYELLDVLQKILYRQGEV